jgi:hypothetical protein
VALSCRAWVTPETVNLERFELQPEDNLAQESRENQPEYGRSEASPRPDAGSRPGGTDPGSDAPGPETPLPEELPAEAQGEVNGGPLGCCLGVMIGLLISLAIAVLSRLYADPLAHILQGNLSLITRIVMALLAIVGAIAFGYFGWKIGKRVYREYDPPVVKDRGRKAKPKTMKKKAM